jgi:hypothetical protein
MKKLYTIIIENGPTAADCHSIVVKAKNKKKAKKKAIKIFSLNHFWDNDECYVSKVFETIGD